AGARAVGAAHIAADSPAQLLYPLSERRTADRYCRIVSGLGHEPPDAPPPLALLRARRERPRDRPAESGQQFPPSDGDCHTPLPCEVRKWNDTTPRACCPNCVAPGAGGEASGALASRDRRPTTLGLAFKRLFSA